MKNKTISFLVAMTLSVATLVSCSKDNKINQNSLEKTEQNQGIKDSTDKNNNSSNVTSSKKENESSQAKSEETNQTNDNINKVDNTDTTAPISINNISEKVKAYILNGQNDKPEAQKLKWNTEFLNKIDIDSLYNNYIKNGEDSSNIEKFAEYITLNAPILDNWEELFKKNLYDIYGEEAVRLENIEDDLYQAYIIKNGSEVPYVVVSSRTGYFHG